MCVWNWWGSCSCKGLRAKSSALFLLMPSCLLHTHTHTHKHTHFKHYHMGQRGCTGISVCIWGGGVARNGSKLYSVYSGLDGSCCIAAGLKVSIINLSWVNSIYTAQYHKSQICLKGLYNLYSIRHPLSNISMFLVMHHNTKANSMYVTWQ